MQQQLWKDIPSYEGLYQISQDGTVKGLKRRQKGLWSEKTLPERIITKIQRLDYEVVILHKLGTKRVHRVDEILRSVFSTHQGATC